jgi:stage II sporulation protein D
LSVPDKIRRRFEGVLELRPARDEILAIVTMPRRVYLASTLAVEASPEWSPEALAAQAVVSRSFAAAPRHRGYDVCDTTHCQFTGAPPPNDSKMWLAVERTDALLLTYLARPIEALFTRSCSGATKTLADIGLARDGGYPFYRAPCTRCALKPDRWQRELPAPAALPLLARPHQEAARLEAVRSLGWDAAPSNSYEIEEQNGRIRLTGVGYGHGVGYCQRGGTELASQGWRFDAILRRYFPNTILSELK